MRWKNILVATDLSEAADLAVREAHDRAGSEGRLLVSHVMPSRPHTNPVLPQINLSEAEAATARQQQDREAVTSRVAHLTGRGPTEFSVAIGEGDAAVAIIRLAESVQADLVVLGSYGATGLSRILLGTVAERVTRLAPCTVLVARPRTGSRSIVAGTDFSDPAMPALDAACDEAARVGGRVTLVHSFDLPLANAEALVGGTTLPPLIDFSDQAADALKRLQDILVAHGVAGECRVAYEWASRALVREAEAVRADLLVVGTHGRTGISRMLLGSVAEAVVRTAPCSVLVVRLRPHETA